MPFQVAAIIFITFSAVFGAFMAPRSGDYTRIQIATAWFLLGVVAFVVSDDLAALIIMLPISVALSRVSAEKRIYFYIATLTAVPVFLSANLPFPGLNYLIELNFTKIHTLVVLGPIFLAALSKKPPPVLRKADLCILLFILLVGVLSIRNQSFTSMLRTIIDQMILGFIPYITISRTLTNREHFENALKAFFTGILITAMLGVISTLRSWNIYSTLSDSILNYKSFSDYRNGFLRIGVTSTPVQVGLFMGLGLALSFLYRRTKEITAPTQLLLAAMFLGVCFTTGSRGGWLSGAVVFSLYLILLRAKPSMRSLVAMGLGATAIFGFVLILNDSVSVSDQYGTFAYRTELIKTAMLQIRDTPLFGTPDILILPRFQHLRQGEGIIDIVNVFIGIALFHGLISLALFCYAHFSTIAAGIKTLNIIDRSDASPDDKLKSKSILSIICACQIGFMVLISTISGASTIMHFSYIFLALLIGATRAMSVKHSQPLRSKIRSADVQLQKTVMNT